MTQDGLTDPLPRHDLTAQQLAYNNNTDRIRVELPPAGDVAASGVVSLDIDTLPPSGIPVSIDQNNGDSIAIWSASGTTDIPVYLTSPIPVAVAVDIESDSIKAYSASGSAALETWINNQPLETISASPNDALLIKKRFTYNANDNIDTLKEALIATPSGSACKMSTFTYNANDDIDYIVESIDTW